MYTSKIADVAQWQSTFLVRTGSGVQSSPSAHFFALRASKYRPILLKDKLFVNIIKSFYLEFRY